MEQTVNDITKEYNRLRKKMYNPLFYLPAAGLFIFTGRQWLVAFICQSVFIVSYMLLTMVAIQIGGFYQKNRTGGKLLACAIIVGVIQIAAGAYYYIRLFANTPESLSFIY